MGLISPFIPLYISVLPSYFGLAFPLILLVAYAVAIFGIGSFWKRKFFYALVFCSFFFVPRFFNINCQNDEKGINVLSYNLRGGYSIVNRDKNEENKDLIELEKLLTSDIDILLIQENNQRIINWVSEYLPFKNVERSERSGTLIASNFEIINRGEIDFGTKVNSCIWADLRTPEGIVRVYNVHFQSSHIYEETEKVIDEGKEYNPNVFRSMNRVLSKHSKQGLKRIKQAQLVKAHIARCKYSVILGGDFNETPMSYTYQIMQEDLHDHFKTSTGYGATFPESFPLVRIDFIMSSKNIECNRFEILRNISLSDHLPVLSTIDIKKTSK